MTAERRDDREVLEKLDEIHTDVKEMRTAIFGPEYDPKMGFVYRVEKRFESIDSRLDKSDGRIGRLETKAVRHAGIITGIVIALQAAWEWIKFKAH